MSRLEELMAEIWAPAVGYEGRYEVSTDGRIRSLLPKLKGGIKKTSINHRGYESICLTDSAGVERTKVVHRVVAATFIPNPAGLREVNHKNGIKTDNRVENLEWVTPSQNVLHWYETGKNQRRVPVFGVNLETGERIDFASMTAAEEYGYIASSIRRCIAGTRKTHKGHTWFIA